MYEGTIKVQYRQISTVETCRYSIIVSVYVLICMAYAHGWLLLALAARPSGQRPSQVDGNYRSEGYGIDIVDGIAGEQEQGNGYNGRYCDGGVATTGVDCFTFAQNVDRYIV